MTKITATERLLTTPSPNPDFGLPPEKAVQRLQDVTDLRWGKNEPAEGIARIPDRDVLLLLMHVVPQCVSGCSRIERVLPARQWDDLRWLMRRWLEENVAREDFALPERYMGK